MDPQSVGNSIWSPPSSTLVCEKGRLASSQRWRRPAAHPLAAAGGRRQAAGPAVTEALRRRRPPRPAPTLPRRMPPAPRPNPLLLRPSQGLQAATRTCRQAVLRSAGLRSTAAMSWIARLPHTPPLEQRSQQAAEAGWGQGCQLKSASAFARGGSAHSPFSFSATHKALDAAPQATWLAPDALSSHSMLNLTRDAVLPDPQEPCRDVC